MNILYISYMSYTEDMPGHNVMNILYILYVIYTTANISGHIANKILNIRYTENSFG